MAFCIDSCCDGWKFPSVMLPLVTYSISDSYIVILAFKIMSRTLYNIFTSSFLISFLVASFMAPKDVIIHVYNSIVFFTGLNFMPSVLCTFTRIRRLYFILYSQFCFLNFLCMLLLGNFKYKGLFYIYEIVWDNKDTECMQKYIRYIQGCLTSDTPEL